MARTGRRSGEPRTRDAILDAARGRFAAAGYRGTTIRAIAADAAVDPALVHHYFGTKRDLFVAVIDFPVSPDVLLDTLAQSPRDEIGERIVRTFLGIWSNDEYRQRMLVLIRSAINDEDAARMVREFITGALLEPVAERIGSDRPELRASLVATQLIGFAFLRYLMEFAPLPTTPAEQLVAAYGPTIQRYLTGDLS